jgi:hypothetical protein
MAGSRAVRRFTDSAISRATNTARHSGDGWAEAHLQATNFGLPVQSDQRKRARATDNDVSREYHGATHNMVMSEQTQSGDLTPHGVPPQYAHPQRLGRDVLDPGGPRILPVSQEIEHGPEQSRSAEFQEAAELGALHASLGFYDRRFEGRRHRSGHMYEPRQEAPTRGGWQRDVNTLDRLTNF